MPATKVGHTKCTSPDSREPRRSTPTGSECRGMYLPSSLRI
ncbi:hypothetical protein [Lysobacter gummosus]